MIIILVSLITFRKFILQSEWGIFSLAFLFFSLSISVDLVPALNNNSTDLSFLIEDGLKLFGIVSWVGYFMILSYQVLRPPLIINKH